MMPRIPHPSMNPACFMCSGLPGVYDTEEELLEASEKGRWLKVKWMEFKFGITVVSVLRSRLRYYRQFAPPEGE
jgi:hypothetical protein